MLFLSWLAYSFAGRQVTSLVGSDCFVISLQFFSGILNLNSTVSWGGLLEFWSHLEMETGNYARNRAALLLQWYVPNPLFLLLFSENGKHRERKRTSSRPRVPNITDVQEMTFQIQPVNLSFRGLACEPRKERNDHRGDIPMFWECCTRGPLEAFPCPGAMTL